MTLPGRAGTHMPEGHQRYRVISHLAHSQSYRSPIFAMGRTRRIHFSGFLLVILSKEKRQAGQITKLA